MRETESMSMLRWGGKEEVNGDPALVPAEELVEGGDEISLEEASDGLCEERTVLLRGRGGGGVFYGGWQRQRCAAGGEKGKEEEKRK